MDKIKNLLRTIFTAGAITASACSMPNIAQNIESVVNSAQEHISEFQESEYQKQLLGEWVEEKVDELDNWKNDLINPLFGFTRSNSIISTSQRRKTVDFDSFADIDSSIVTDFQERYSSPSEMQEFLIDTLRHTPPYLMYGTSFYIPSTKVALNENEGVCSTVGVSLIPAALEDNHYIPIVLQMYNKEEVITFGNFNITHYGPGVGHTIFLYHSDLVDETTQHNLYDSEASLEIFSDISFRDFMHNSPGWYTAGVNASDFNGPYNSVDDIVEHYNYLNRIILNLNDYDADFKYSNENLWDIFPSYDERELRFNLQDDWQIDLTNKVTLLIDNPFIPDQEDNLMYPEHSYLSFLENYIPLLSQNSESPR